jgi:DNA-binding CsgD family transcriptional regulator
VNIGDVAVLACRDAHGCWGWLELYRNADDRPFSGRELRLLADLSPTLGALSRRGARADAAGPSGVDPAPSGAAVLILDAELGLVGQTAAARRWVAALPAAQLFAGWGILPAVVYPTAVRALHGRPDLATALNRTVDGTWLSVSAARLEDASGVAVTLRPATSAEVTALLGRAYGLTGRERQVARLVADGHRTEDIARRMAISGWTVQDHLKAAFDKLGVHRREELVGLLAGGPRLQPEDPGQVARH